ncbi:hypothetical protein ACROYT_G003773 [Oculina patagonica]
MDLISNSSSGIKHKGNTTSNTEETPIQFISLIFASFLVISLVSLFAVLYSIVCVKLWSREIPGKGTNQNEVQAEALKVAKQIALNGDVIAPLVPNWEEHDVVAEFAKRVGDSTL